MFQTYLVCISSLYHIRALRCTVAHTNLRRLSCYQTCAHISRHEEVEGTGRLDILANARVTTASMTDLHVCTSGRAL